jgi:phage terminase large subunit GpA-like protein
VDAEYLAQLTAEKAIRKYVKGRGAVREWVKLRQRNEALDLEVYALGALYILGQPFVHSLQERAERWAQPLGDAETNPPHRERTTRLSEPWIPRQRGWVNRWRR